ncbi:DUF695 domain-containing protein [Cytophagaceae bacterium YF14B1]|uniref:DUF695 domain-containing protein n=1 Tax=Xanthocytophaga flava TaxID=3048013 RepID=A0AAE3QRG3_9BACT|nr:DUF695 domain-containing protein [Xanthocytophaga flavus]MDJ1481855.1 DUF695 domain-containing protein [Xanthocytophaga flavus]
MSFLNNIIDAQNEVTQQYVDFWDWFKKHAKTFFYVVKQRENIETDFFEKLSEQLNVFNESLYFVVGMPDEDTVELIFTADGIIKNIVFVEELVQAAPSIKGWIFTALKSATDTSKINIKMEGFDFNEENIGFYANEHPELPDEIDITIVYPDFDEDDRQMVVNGIYIFLDNVLGELNFACIIDQIDIVRKQEAEQEIVPISKLKSFLIWREKEFVEKYEGVRRNTDKDNYSMLQAKLENGNMLLAAINTDLLKWDRKASHPWIMNVEIKYDGSELNGMPDEDAFTLMEEIEENITTELKDSEGYLNIGRQTAEGARNIYFACKDFRKSSKVVDAIERLYADQAEISYEIYKDKYWQSFEHFVNA